ncbi:MucR family transcriptional regulator [Novosphingobium sp. JCM 18896]|uniref:MucR family transcriptional regulator n=1 Tax=Novosphingobium sp. JCM 18896 TaxID=2989731 RepID=UPI0022226F47|nr:MucR family transcriptional regulator [Novosphingobium sp. JCM 18896]MCW1430901.1 MucR family transcriptional regulator [Novosphingobium sp. JCM 18896]
MAEDTSNSSTEFLEFATELTIAWLSNPNTRAAAEDVPAFLQTMHGAVKDLASGPAASDEVAAAKPGFVGAVSVRRSLASKDHLISLIDGKPYRTLKRHLATHGLTPAEYRERYKLKSDYPMVAETYAAQRRAIAKQVGLGRKPGEKTNRSKAKPAADAANSSPARRGRTPAKAPAA